MYQQHTADLTVFNMKQLLRGSCLLYMFGSGHDATFVQPTLTVALMADASRPGLWLCGCFQLSTNPRNYREKKNSRKKKKTPPKKSCLRPRLSSCEECHCRATLKTHHKQMVHTKHEYTTLTFAEGSDSMSKSGMPKVLTANSQHTSSCLRCPVSIFSTLYLNHPTSPSPLTPNVFACPV